MKKLRVVHIIGALPVGGVERNLLRVLPALDRERFEVSVITLREKGALAAQFEEAGIPVELCYMKSRYHPLSLWRLACRLKEMEADIVQCHMRRANTSGRIAAMLAGVPVRLATEHDIGLGKNWRHYLVDRILARYNDPVICVSNAVKEHNRQYSHLPDAAFHVQYLGLELEPFLEQQDRTALRQRFNLPLTRPIVGYVGRLHQGKGLELLLRAIACIDVDLPAPCLVLVGQGREKENLENLAHTLEISDRVIFLPWQDDLPEVYACLDVFAFASESEGFGAVIIEAAAAGVPIVSTPVGIVAEALEPGRDYIQVDWTWESIAAGLADALEPERAAELIVAGREHVKRFSIATQRDHMSSFYKDLYAASQADGGEGKGR